MSEGRDDAEQKKEKKREEWGEANGEMRRRRSDKRDRTPRGREARRGRR